MNGLQEKIIDKVLEAEATGKFNTVTEWEVDFCISLEERGSDYELSEKQNSILNRIWGKL